MKPIPTLLAAGAATAFCVALLAAFTKNDAAAAVPTPSSRLERGRYLVHRSGMCIDCHSPRNEKGEFIKAKHLAGAPIGFTPKAPMPWTPVAPRLAGLPAGFTNEDLVHFLMTGERPHGRPGPLPPMPAYRFNREDAEAIAAYLASLPVPAP